MNPRKLSILAVALAAATFAGGCSRSDRTADNTYGNEPAKATPDEPTTAAPTSTAAGTNTAATDTTGTQPAATSPAPTTTAPTTAPAGPVTTADATTPFDDLDTNKDGGLSRDELPATNPLLQDFSTADKDGNGTLSRSEIDEQRGKMPPGG
jgi:hypothetical protein